jgi:hypothetical protein
MKYADGPPLRLDTIGGWLHSSRCIPWCRWRGQHSWLCILLLVYRLLIWPWLSVRLRLWLWLWGVRLSVILR